MMRAVGGGILFCFVCVEVCVVMEKGLKAELVVKYLKEWLATQIVVNLQVEGSRTEGGVKFEVRSE